MDVEKLNIGAGDIVIYCIRCGSKKVAGYTHGQIRGLVYDGKKLRQVYLWTFVKDLSLFVKYLPKNDASLLEPIVEKLSEAIANNKGNDVLYKGGYFLKASKCYRCGWCCIRPGVEIVRPEFLESFSRTKFIPEMIVFKNDNVPCPHLVWGKDNKSLCMAHKYEWFQYSLCSNHKWNGSTTQCSSWELVEKIVKEEGPQWYMRYYQGCNVEEYVKKFYELNERASKELPSEFARKLFI